MPPPCVLRDTLLIGASRARQTRHVATRRAIDKCLVRLEKTGEVAGPRDLTIKSGTRLVRSWQGRTYHVLVLDDGFEHEGRRYESLSQIARAITGAHWSGPRFFGLRKRKAPFRG